MRSLLLFVAFAACLVLVYGRPPTVYQAPSSLNPIDVESLAKLTADNLASIGEYARRQPRPQPTQPDPNGPIAQTELGAVQGYTDLAGVNVWRGIPFAAPPVGDLRLRATQPGIPWNGTLNTFTQGPICPQLHITDWLYLGDEDCLSINVYVPASANTSSALPVFVWIYGGAYVIGDSDEFGLYDGVNMAATLNMLLSHSIIV